MKVFVFCIAIFLASAVNSSPIETEIVESNDISVLFESVLQQDVAEDAKLHEEIIEIEELEQEKEVDETVHVINETSENEVAVPYEDKAVEEAPLEDEEKLKVIVGVEEPVEEIEGEAFQDVDDYVEMTEDEKEAAFGIEIPLCMQHTENRIPLHLSHPHQCGKFYKCYEGRGYLMDCPAGEHWSVNLDRCDYPGLAKCRPNGELQFKIKKAKPMKATQEESDDDDKPEVGEFEVDPRCEGSDPFKPLHFKHVSDCTKFYKCYMGKAYVIKCPKGQQWAQHLNRCEHPSLARCQITRPVIVRPAQAEEAVEDEEDDGPKYDKDFIVIDPRCATEDEDEDMFHPIKFPHPTNCGAFYMCYDHRAFKYPCPGSLHYNQKTQECDYPRKARCKLTPTVVAAQASESIEDDDEVVEDEHTIMDDADYKIVHPRCTPNDPDDLTHPIQFVHPTDCNMFYKCFGHKAYKHQCPFSLHFNEEEEMCDYPWHIRRTDCKPAAAASFMQASADTPKIPACLENDNLPIEGHFNKYWECKDGAAFYMECAAQQLFNPQSKKCETPVFPPDMMERLPQLMMQYPEFMGQFGSMMRPMPQLPGQPQFPGVLPQRPGQFPMQAPPQLPNRVRPQNPTNVEFPSWMPVPKPHIPIPEIVATPDKPSGPKETNDKATEFNFQNGKMNSRCPSNDEPLKPTHLSHETDCGKFYKCFNGRAFLMTCPEAQEWSDDLQRCDYHEFANCDPIELMKKKIQH